MFRFSQLSLTCIGFLSLNKTKQNKPEFKVLSFKLYNSPCFGVCTFHDIDLFEEDKTVNLWNIPQSGSAQLFPHVLFGFFKKIFFINFWKHTCGNMHTS